MQLSALRRQRFVVSASFSALRRQRFVVSASLLRASTEALRCIRSTSKNHPSKPAADAQNNTMTRISNTTLWAQVQALAEVRPINASMNPPPGEGWKRAEPCLRAQNGAICVRNGGERGHMSPNKPGDAIGEALGRRFGRNAETCFNPDLRLPCCSITPAACTFVSVRFRKSEKRCFASAT